MKSKQRQAQLQQAYAGLYPGFPCQEWRPVGEVVERMAVARLRRGPRAAGLFRKRLLDARHFDFRGGRPERAGRELRSRSSDTIAVEQTGPPRRTTRNE